MPYVKCPSCGERGKIGPALVGTRIKCKQCGVSFQVSPPPVKATAGLMSDFASPRASVPDGIEVEGLDASAWTLSTEVGVALKAVATAEPDAQAGASIRLRLERSVAGGPPIQGAHLQGQVLRRQVRPARLEEALNHFGRQGWAVKSMSTPHVKGFTGVMEETIVVLLEG